MGKSRGGGRVHKTCTNFPSLRWNLDTKYASLMSMNSEHKYTGPPDADFRPPPDDPEFAGEELHDDVWDVFLLDDEESLPEEGDFWVDPDDGIGD